MSVLKRLLVLTAATLLLGSCYLPVKFDAEIELDRAGYYSMIFDGYLAEIPLYQDIVNKKITRAEEKKRVDVLRTDFTRDSAVKQFEYYKQGVFKVHWEKKGDLLRDRMVTFARRNEAMLTLKYVKTDRLITVSAGGMSTTQREQVLNMGLNVQGEIRVITDAKVVRHNATFTKAAENKPGNTMYVWRLKSVMDPSPLLELQPG